MVEVYTKLHLYNGVKKEDVIELSKKWNNQSNVQLSSKHNWLNVHKNQFGFEKRLLYNLNPSVVNDYIQKVYKDYNQCVEFSLASSITCGIYAIFLGELNFYYYGLTANQSFGDRWDTHYASLKRGTHSNERMQNAFNKTHVFLPMIIFAKSINKKHKKEIYNAEKLLRKLMWNNNYNKI